MTSLGSIAAPDYCTSQSKDRYRPASFPVVVVAARNDGKLNYKYQLCSQIKNRTTIFIDHKKSAQRFRKDQAKTKTRPQTDHTNTLCPLLISFFHCEESSLLSLLLSSSFPNEKQENGRLLVFCRRARLTQ